MLKNKGLSDQIRWHERRLKNGQNTIYMPWQCLRDGAKALILLGSLDGNVEFTPLEDWIGII